MPTSSSVSALLSWLPGRLTPASLVVSRARPFWGRNRRTDGQTDGRLQTTTAQEEASKATAGSSRHHVV